MNILFLMIPVALILGFGFVVAFFWAVGKGQFDDIETPAMRVLENDDHERKLK